MGATGAAAVILGTLGVAGAVTQVSAPLVCNRGPSGQRFKVGVTLPATAEADEVYSIRIDAYNSGKVSHFGLCYLHHLTVQYLLPRNVSYVEGSAKLVPGTGTQNVLAGARVWHDAGIVTMQLPGRVENGTDYTPPSIVVQVRATGAPGTPAVLGFTRFALQANAFLVGDVTVTCDPTPHPYPLGATMITRRPEG
jgi:hypothetical protein